jgi:flagellar hook-associated protein 3 FlgL
VRVTDRLTFDHAAQDTGRARDASEVARRQVARGTRVEHPGDDPATAGLIAAHGLTGERFRALSQAAGLASDELGATDGALGNIADALSRARQLAVQFSNAGYPAAQTQMGAQEVKALTGGIVSMLNTRHGNRYLFGGTRDDAPPFAADGSYLGDAGLREVEIAPGVLQQANVRADVVMKGAGGGVDALGALQALEAALQAHDQAGVRATLDALDASIAQVSAGRAQAGTAMHAFDVAVSAGKITADDEEATAAKLGEVDLVDASVRLAMAQHALEASLSATAQSFRLTLLDYLR